MERQIVKEIAPLSARQVMEESIGEEKAKLNSKLNGGNLFDKNETKKNLDTLTKQYDRTRPETLSSEAQNGMWKRAKQLKDEFMVGMLSRDELHPVKAFLIEGTMKTVIDEKKLQSLNSVKREQEWALRNENKIREFKNIMRHLCPDDPGATNIEKYRPMRRIK